MIHFFGKNIGSPLALGVPFYSHERKGTLKNDKDKLLQEWPALLALFFWHKWLAPMQNQPKEATLDRHTPIVVFSCFGPSKGSIYREHPPDG